MVIAWCNEEGGYANAREKLEQDFGIRISVAGVADFWQWWHLRRRYRSYDSTAANVQELLRKQNPNLSAEQLREVGQAIFTSEAINQENVQAFVALSKVRLAERKLEHDIEVFRTNLKSKLEAGLDALFEEIRGNAKAEEIYHKLRETLEAEK